jgi:hypothetical protein
MGHDETRVTFQAASYARETRCNVSRSLGDRIDRKSTLVIDDQLDQIGKREIAAGNS